MATVNLVIRARGWFGFPLLEIIAEIDMDGQFWVEKNDS